MEPKVIKLESSIKRKKTSIRTSINNAQKIDSIVIKEAIKYGGISNILENYREFKERNIFSKDQKIKLIRVQWLFGSLVTSKRERGTQIYNHMIYYRNQYIESLKTLDELIEDGYKGHIPVRNILKCALDYTSNTIPIVRD